MIDYKYSYEEWMLKCFKSFDEAANSNKFSETWREDMARHAGYYLGRYYHERMEGLYCAEEAQRESVKRTKPVDRGAASANALSILIREPQYADKIKIRI